MTDLELTKKCAEALGWKFLGLASKHVAFQVSDCAIISTNDSTGDHVFDPLHDDAQAMALVKKLQPCIVRPDSNGWWEVYMLESERAYSAKDLNRAICECVAALPLDEREGAG